MPGESIYLSEGEHFDYQITQNNLIWRYHEPLPYIPNFDTDYVEFSGFAFWIKRLVFVQLEQDGRIFLLRKTQKLPIAIPAKQPEGYPLTPLP
jgi:hypothetical protein